MKKNETITLEKSVNNDVYRIVFKNEHNAQFQHFIDNKLMEFRNLMSLTKNDLIEYYGYKQVI